MIDVKVDLSSNVIRDDAVFIFPVISQTSHPVFTLSMNYSELEKCIS